MKGSATSEGQKRQLFLQNEGLFKASTWSLVSQLHACENWRCCGNHNYQKIWLECTSVDIDRNRSMASQRVNVQGIILPTCTHCHHFYCQSITSSTPSHHFQSTVNEEIFVGEKFRTLPCKTFCTELNFVLSRWPDRLMPVAWHRRKLGMEFI